MSSTGGGAASDAAPPGILEENLIGQDAGTSSLRTSMTTIKAGLAGEIPPGTMKAAEGGKEILVANLGGTFVAMGNRCTHMGCRLSEGTLAGDRVTCPCHGSTFDLRNGAVVKGPARLPEQPYRVRVEEGIVLVEI